MEVGQDVVKRIRLRQGEIEFADSGRGRPVVFVHGVFTNGLLWRKVTPGIAAAGHRCIAPHWPFGAHRLPMDPAADLGPLGIVDLIADFLDALDLRDVVLVGNDTGGAFVQMLLARRPERVGAVVLTPSDCFTYFPPPLFRFLVPFSRVPGAGPMLAAALGVKALHRLPIVLGWLAKHPVPDDVKDAYTSPLRRDAGVRRDAVRFLRGLDRRHTLAAAEALPKVTVPVLLAWATEDRVIPWAKAEELADLLPDVRLEGIADSYTLVPEDQPARLTDLIVDFLGHPEPLPGR